MDFLQEVGLANRGLGLELGSLSAQNVEKFRARLPEARIVDCSKTVDWIRMVKSELEIAMMREAAGIADAAIMRPAEVIRPGVREADAAAEIVAAQVRGNPKRNTATGMLPLLMCSSPRTGTLHILWSEDVFGEGSQVNIELSGNRHGYVAAIMRTFSIGRPSDRLRRLHEAEVAGLEAALNAVRPGRTCTIEKRGFKKDSRCGYAIGIEWMEPTASLADGDMTELRSNMTFHLMLGNWVEEEFGYVISETFRVTKSDTEVFTHAPRKIFEL
ncbi:M24 family metallopeptidase [Bradyrhizobium sp. RDT10]